MKNNHLVAVLALLAVVSADNLGERGAFFFLYFVIKAAVATCRARKRAKNSSRGLMFSQVKCLQKGCK